MFCANILFVGESGPAELESVQIVGWSSSFLYTTHKHKTYKGRETLLSKVIKPRQKLKNNKNKEQSADVLPENGNFAFGRVSLYRQITKN